MEREVAGASAKSQLQKTNYLGVVEEGGSKVFVARVCLTITLNRRLLWFWSAAPRPCHGFTSPALQESHKINHPSPAGSHIQLSSAKTDKQLSCWYRGGDATNPLWPLYQDSSKPRIGSNGSNGYSELFHNPTCLRMADYKPRSTRQVHSLPHRGEEDTLRGPERDAPHPQLKCFLPAPSVPFLLPRPQPAAHFTNSFPKGSGIPDGAQTVAKEGGREGERGQRLLLQTVPLRSSALSSPISVPPPLRPPPRSWAQGGAREAA